MHSGILLEVISKEREREGEEREHVCIRTHATSATVYDLVAYLHRSECKLCHVGELRAADSTRDGTSRVPEAPKRHSANFPEILAGVSSG